MKHLTWEDNLTGKEITCTSNTAKKYQVNNMLTVGQSYKVVNESEVFIFILDNSDRVAGYYKEYFNI